MSDGTVVAAGEKVEKTYFRRLFDVLQVKGTVLLLAFPVGLFVWSEYPDLVDPLAAGAVLAAALLLGVVVDRHLDPRNRIDIVGVFFVIVALGYGGIAYQGIEFEWFHFFGAGVLVLVAVAYEYAFRGRNTSDGLRDADVDPLNIDVVGFVVAELILVYSILHATGWGGFADSATFGALAFVVYTTTAAVFAGYAVVTREIVISRTSEEIHEALIGVLADVVDVDHEPLRKDIGLDMRKAAESLDGVKLPTVLEDSHGNVPVVVSTRRPDTRRADVTTEEVLELAKRQTFTGYAVHDHDEVLMFRNGELFCFYGDGRYLYDEDEIEDSVGDATFHSLEYQTLYDLEEITPDETTEWEPDEVKEGLEAKEVSSGQSVGSKLEIGGEEIEVEEMFAMAEQIGSGKEPGDGVERTEKEGSTSGDEDEEEEKIDDIMDRVDDVLDEMD